MRVKPIRTDADHEAALKDIECLWGAPDGTQDGTRLDVPINLVDAYEQRRYPIGEPKRSAAPDPAFPTRLLP